MNNEQQTQQADDPSGPGWRDVTTGGVTQDGDMVRCDDNFPLGPWVLAEPGETVTDDDVVRRRIEPQPEPQPSPDDPSGDGWRDVRPDEILQADDMAQWDHGWSRARVPGIIAGSYPRYRRRIEQQPEPQPSPDDPSGEGSSVDTLPDPPFTPDDTSGPALTWLDVEVGDKLRYGDIFRAFGKWKYTKNIGVTVSEEWKGKYRRIGPHPPQPQAKPDDPSGDGWRWVRQGETLELHDMMQAEGEWWPTKNAGQTCSKEGMYRRRIDPQQPSDSEPETMEQLRKRLDAAVRQNVELADRLANERRSKTAHQRIAKASVSRAQEAEALVAEAERSGQQVNAELQQLKEQVRDLTRQAQFDAVEMQNLRDQLHESQRTAQRYRNQLEGAWEHAPKGPRNFRERMVLEKFRAFVEAQEDDPLTFGYVQLRATDPQVLGCSEFVVESWHQDVGGGRLSECVRVFLRHYASEEDQESRKEISARTYFHVKTVGDYERLLSLLGIGGQTE
ncbi:MAG: hypothetical protein RIT02_2637 [Planctomycetota bacterium]